MNIFLDTSVVLKLYLQEADSTAWRTRLRTVSGDIYLTTLSQVEFASAATKKARVGQTALAVAEAAIRLFRQDVGKCHWIPLTDSVLVNAGQLVEKHATAGLRTLDALQLAAALTVRTHAGLFLTADQRLETIFQQEGLPTE